MDIYEVTIGGLPHQVQMTAEQAKKSGARKVEASVEGKAKESPNKSRTGRNKARVHSPDSDDE